jgi:hypothetical protein
VGFIDIIEQNMGKNGQAMSAQAEWTAGITHLRREKEGNESSIPVGHGLRRCSGLWSTESFGKIWKEEEEEEISCSGCNKRGQLLLRGPVKIGFLFVKTEG